MFFYFIFFLFKIQVTQNSIYFYQIFYIFPYSPAFVCGCYNLYSILNNNEWIYNLNEVIYVLKVIAITQYVSEIKKIHVSPVEDQSLTIIEWNNL